MNASLTEPQSASKKPEPVILRTPHDYSLTEAALESRKDELKKLAKKTTDEGYAREGRAIQADADAIEHHILPSFRAQRALPLVSPEQLEKEVSGALRRFIFKGFDGLGDPKVLITPESIERRRDMVLGAVAQRVSLFAAELADQSFAQGLAAREQTAEGLAMRAISTLRATGE